MFVTETLMMSKRASAINCHTVSELYCYQKSYRVSLTCTLWCSCHLVSPSVTWCHIVKESVIWVYCRIDNALSIVSQRHGARSTHSLAPNNLHTVTMSNRLNNLQLFKFNFFHLNVGETFVNTQQNTLSNIRIYWHVAQCLADSLIWPEYVNIVD